MKVANFKNIAVAALLVLLGLASCNIKDSLDDCSGTFLLDYTAYSDQILDDIDPESVVNIYVFDKSDYCSEILTYTYAELQDNDFEFEVPIQYRGCNVVAWHGADDSDYRHSMALGVKLENFMVRLKEGSRGGFCCVPSELWASNLEKVDFCASLSRHRIHMMRLHTEVNVALNIINSDGTSTALDMCKYKVNISAIADIYNIDNSVSDYSDDIIYDNSEEIAEAEPLKYGHAGTLRLTTDRDCYLYITNVKTGERVSIGSKDKIDLVKYMLDSNGGSSGNDDIDQKFLDLNKVWNIELTVDQYYVAVSLTINGWTVWFDNTDLD